jgi:hypothetical protein
MRGTGHPGKNHVSITAFLSNTFSTVLSVYVPVSGSFNDFSFLFVHMPQRLIALSFGRPSLPRRTLRIFQDHFYSRKFLSKMGNEFFALKHMKRA